MRIRRALLAVAAGTTVLAVSSYGWLQWEIGKIARFEELAPRPSLSPTSQGNTLPPTEDLPEVLRILVFSVGSSGLEDGDGTRLGIGNGRAAMRDGLTDSLMLLSLRPDSGRVDLLSLPRDLWLSERGHRVNESYNRYGVWGLVDDVEILTGLRADHAVAVNFAAFADLTDAVGGVPIWLDHPVRDIKSKLSVPTAGCVTLTGSDALAFVRSRHWQVQRDGIWRADATSSDWGRIERQQSFLRAVAGRLLNWKLPTRVPELLGVARDNLVLDQQLTLRRLVSLATDYATNGMAIHASTYPGRGGVTESGASVIYPDIEAGLAQVAAAEALAADTTATGVPTAPGSPGIPARAGATASKTTSVSAGAGTPSAGGFAPARDGSGGLRYHTC